MRLIQFIFLLAILPASAGAQPFLVKDGQSNAEIVIAPEAPRSTRLAADELRTYVSKISGAQLAVVSSPGADMPVKIYIGESPRLEKLGITARGLEHGAYRIVSGADYLVLLGDDKDFVPREPWARNNGGIVSGKLQADWEAATGLALGAPNRGMYKNRTLMPEELAKEDREYYWGFDERGSFNAVCGFLRSLGVRWYLPGEIGEVLPKMNSIPLPDIDETVRPDFPVRRFNIRFSTVSADTRRWFMRLGIRDPYGLMVAHGMHTMTHTDGVLSRHPDWFALYGGKRATQKGERLNHLCYSNPGLFEATVQWARAQFDIYDYQSVSIMPPDAYISICQCTLCEGKDVPEMGSRGKLSNHVWDFVNRVAVEVGKTHPDKIILCCAYGANTSPPTNIDKLEPNVQVMIVGGRRPRSNLPEQQEEIRQLRAGWQTKTANPFMVFENYPFTARGWYLPAFIAKTQAESIDATKGHSLGEDIWLSLGRDFDTKDIGFNHFQVYFTARNYWGGSGRDPAALLDEYCQSFYGPAAAEMKTFFAYCEEHWQSMETDKEKVDQALAHFAAAQAKAGPESVHAKRLALVDDFLRTLRSKSALLGQKRGPVTKLRTVWEPKTPIAIDGVLDEPYWIDTPGSSTGALRELQTGERPVYGTTVKTAWDRSGQNLYFAIRCEERPGEELNIATTENDDGAIWYGDAVEILIETDSHSYYQLAIAPSGALVDLDRGADKSAWYRWQSQAEVATKIADDHWIIEIRIPVTDDANDPLNQVVGRKPSQSLPWHFNICRQRIRESGAEHSAFSPTGTKTFHEPMKFAHLYDGRSHQFEADPTVTDFLTELRKAKTLADFEALAEIEGITNLQRSHALSLAARAARSRKDLDRAEAIAAEIPLEPEAKTAAMENLLARRDFKSLLEQFGPEDLAAWPFTRVGAAAWARARAHSALKHGERAGADLQLAIAHTSDPRTRLTIQKTLANNYELVLNDDNTALETYQSIIDANTNSGGADYFYSLQGAARILTRQQKYDEALATLDLADPGKLTGTWRPSINLSRAQTLTAAGRTQEAKQVFQQVIADKNAAKPHRQKASEMLGKLDKSP